jgi:hypothetical protein
LVLAWLLWLDAILEAPTEPHGTLQRIYRTV